jgi:hypothetical protein
MTKKMTARMMAASTTLLMTEKKLVPVSVKAAESIEVEGDKGGAFLMEAKHK